MPSKKKAKKKVTRKKVTRAVAVRKSSVAKASKYSLAKTPINAKQFEAIISPTPVNQIKTRQGRGGLTFAYVKGSYIKKRLTWIFGAMWNFEIVDTKELHNQIVVTGKLTIHGANGIDIVKMQFGRADIKFKKGTKEAVDIGNDFKASATDALKKCASELGICSDVYSSEDEGDGAVVSTPKGHTAQTGTDYVKKLAGMIEKSEKLQGWVERNNIEYMKLSQQDAQMLIAQILKNKNL